MSSSELATDACAHASVGPMMMVWLTSGGESRERTDLDFEVVPAVEVDWPWRVRWSGEVDWRGAWTGVLNWNLLDRRLRLPE